MNLVVVGATGRTGSQVVEQALQRGHRVTALARRPEQVSLRHDRLVTVAADVFDAARLVEVLSEPTPSSPRWALDRHARPRRSTPTEPQICFGQCSTTM